MCTTMAWINFGVQAVGAVAGYQAEKAGVKARNKAKLANFDEANDRYLREVMFENAKWKNTVQDSQVAIDDMFEALTFRWQGEDLEFEAALDAHRYNKLDAQIQMYKEEYAGEQTGVTATRRASENIRSAGLAVTKSLQNAMLAKDKSVLAKEASRIEANQKRRAQWQSTWRSPVPGPTPEAPILEAAPGMGGLMLNLAIAGATSYFGGKAQAKLNKTNAQLKSFLESQAKSPISGNTISKAVQPIPGANNLYALGSDAYTMNFANTQQILKNQGSLKARIMGTNIGIPQTQNIFAGGNYQSNPFASDLFYRYDDRVPSEPWWARNESDFIEYDF